MVARSRDIYVRSPVLGTPTPVHSSLFFSSRVLYRRLVLSGVLHSSVLSLMHSTKIGRSTLRAGEGSPFNARVGTHPFSLRPAKCAPVLEPSFLRQIPREHFFRETDVETCIGIQRISIWFFLSPSNISKNHFSFYSLNLTTSNYEFISIAFGLSRFQSHQNQLLMGGLGGNRLNWTNFETPSFLAILRDPAGDPHRAGRSGGVWQVRSCIAFSQTLHGPRGFPRDWVSKLRAFEHCRFSSFQTSVRSSVVYPLLPAGHEAL